MTGPRQTVLRITRLSHEHIPLLVPLEVEAYPEPWTHGLFRQEVENGASYFVVASIAEDIVAYGGFWMLLDEAHLTKVTVAPAFRRHGLGERLMQHLIRRAQQAGALLMRLEVRESNLPARQLYEKLGFQQTGLRKGYYAKTNEAAVVMTCDFPPVDAASAH